MKHFYNFLMILFIIGLTTKLYSQSVPSYVPTNGLVGWWGFNGNAQDGSGNGNHGIVNGATLTTDRFGNLNKAYFFDGIDDFIEILFHSSLNSSNGSISAWIKSNGILTNNQNLIYGQGQGRPQICVNSNNNHKARLQWHHQQNGNPSGWAMVTSSSNVDNSQWLQIVGVYDTQNLKIFINGVLEATYSSHLNQWNCSQYNYHIGAFNATSIACGGSLGISQAFNGIIDDIGAWNRALTQQEITNLYNSQLPTQTSLCLPSITTNTPTSIGIDSVIVGGNITNDGGSSIVLRGVCYSTTPNPNMGNMRAEDGAGVGFFSTILRNLSPSTTYYVRSYAKNSNGVVVYGDEVSFSTYTSNGFSSCGGVTDVDGNSYQTVQIGTQCWMQSNLKVSKYRNGDSIPTGLSNSSWQNTTTVAFAIYNNDPVNDGLYGKLYNHYAVMDTRGLCPTGWHVPTDGEWTTLETLLGVGGSNLAGGALKSTAIQPTPGGWNSPNGGATNSSGFTAGPGGLRVNLGDFFNLGNFGYWWSSSLSGTDAWNRRLNLSFGNVDRIKYSRTYGFSVRCLRD